MKRLTNEKSKDSMMSSESEPDVIQSEVLPDREELPKKVLNYKMNMVLTFGKMTTLMG